MQKLLATCVKDHSGPPAMYPTSARRPANFSRAKSVGANILQGPTMTHAVENLSPVYYPHWVSEQITQRHLSKALIALAAAAFITLIIYCNPLGTDKIPVLGAVSLASFASSIAGFAFSPICGAMLFHFGPDPVQVVQIMITCSIVSQATMSWSMRSQIDWKGLSIFLIGGVFGIPIGVYVLLTLSKASYVYGLGWFLVVYGTLMLLKKPLAIQQNVLLDLSAGFVGGITGGAIGFPGGPVSIWCGMKGWTKDRQRAIFQPFIFTMQIVSLIVITMWQRHAHAASAYDWLNLLFVPGALLGTCFGLQLYHRLSDAQFRRAVNVMLVISGLGYLL